jgi:uracil phosphoribosyltransferase
LRKVVLTASDLDGFLTSSDQINIERVNREYEKVLQLFRAHAGTELLETGIPREARERLVSLYNSMGKTMQEITGTEPRIHVYSFETPRPVHGEASRLIAKLRNVQTQQPEFLYYIQRAYELLFNFAFNSGRDPTGGKSSGEGEPAAGEKAAGKNSGRVGRKNYIVVRTPVAQPVQNYAVHKIPDIDALVQNSIMCVMLRGALLPSIIMSKEIQEYSSSNYLTPFALFKISRDDTKEERNMEYILDLDRSYFDLEMLDGRDLFFADPMNATGGSLVTIMRYLRGQGIRPRSVSFFNVLSVLKGALRIVRAIEGIQIYTLWMDPMLNELAYILPGLGDAGDRINGEDRPGRPRNILQLIADYGSTVTSLYRDQLGQIEKTVLGG